jgi:endogenous inhibitor of DNA gyrase (YacG/DUF329 family)
MAVRLVPCPACKTPTPYSQDNRWRPFCSERCRALDLGAWASESYRVAAAAPADQDEPPLPPLPPLPPTH